MHYQGIFPTQISTKILNQFLILFKGNMKVTVGILDIKEIGVGEVTFKKVRQLQKLDTFYNGMYRYLHYEHLPKDKLLARKIKIKQK